MIEKLINVLPKMSWIPGSVYAFIFPWEKLAESAITGFTSIVITVITFFLTRWLSSKYPSKKN